MRSLIDNIYVTKNNKYDKDNRKLLGGNNYNKFSNNNNYHTVRELEHYLLTINIT